MSASPLAFRPRRALAARDGAAPAARPAGETLRLLAWNLGYAGLGAGSDFIAEGGRRALPPSRRAVGAAIGAQTALLRAEPFDVALLQEAARPGPATWWRDHLGALDAALGADADRWFLADVATRLPPAPLGLAHGLAAFSRRGGGAAWARALPSDDKPLFARVRRRFAAIEIALPIEGRPVERGWRLFNVHLSAFDPGAALRARQLEALLERAEAAFSAGAAVILGGDFNYALAQTAFPHDPERAGGCFRHMRSFPLERLPAGWRVLADASTPSVRALDQPYQPGRTMRAVIDGFVLAPNVEAVSVEGLDLGFEPSDHQPVRATVRAL